MKIGSRIKEIQFLHGLTVSTKVPEIENVRASLDFKETGNINPNVRSIIAYNSESELIPTYRFNGILIAEITPMGDFIGGSSSVVQLDAWNWQDALIKADNSIHINWILPQHKHLTSNEHSTTEKNKNIDEQQKLLNETKDLFLAAKDYRKENQISNLKLEAIQKLIDGKTNLTIHTQDAESIIEAYHFFKQLEVKNIIFIVTETATQIIDFIKNNNLNIIITDVHRLPENADAFPFEVYDFPSKLATAGINFGLTIIDKHIAGGRNLGFIAGNTVSKVINREQALKIITLNNAKLLGIDSLYGSIEQGKSATFFISEGDALDMRTQKISREFIDGRDINLNGKQQKLNQKYKSKFNIQ